MFLYELSFTGFFGVFNISGCCCTVIFLYLCVAHPVFIFCAGGMKGQQLRNIFNIIQSSWLKRSTFL